MSLALAGLLLFLVLLVWVPVSAAGADERASGLATPVAGTVQATPTEDATVTALNKEKLKGEIAQQQHTENWLWSNGATILSSFSSTLVIVIGALIAFWRWRGDQRTEREKQAEVRFQSAVTGLGAEKEGPKIGAAILLRTFLRPGYEQFYTQTFDLAITNLCLRRTSPPSDDADGIPHLPEDPHTPLPLDTLRQALIVVFKEAFPLARERIEKRQPLESSFLQKIKVWLKQRRMIEKRFDPQSLDASHIQLDNAYLRGADLRQAWMPEASMRKVFLDEADLRGATLIRAYLSGAYLNGAYLNGADLHGADLHGANLDRADLSGANLSGANLSGADLRWADLSGADLSGATLGGADLSGATLSKANPEAASDLQKTDLRKVTGLTKEQLTACRGKGAITDEDTTTSPSRSAVVKSSLPRPTVKLSPSSQSNDGQPPAASSAQVNTPSPDIGGNGTASSQQGPEHIDSRDAGSSQLLMNQE